VYEVDTDRNQLVVDRLKDLFRDSIIGWELLGDMLCIRVEKVDIQQIMMFLRDDSELGFNFLTTLCGMHWPKEDALGVVYHLHSFAHNHRIRLKLSTPLQNPKVPSITSVWPAANWMEREAYDFYGIEFEGHPNLVRILNMDDMVDFPMRKDFPLEDQTREDKDDSMFGR